MGGFQVQEWTHPKELLVLGQFLHARIYQTRLKRDPPQGGRMVIRPDGLLITRSDEHDRI